MQISYAEESNDKIKVVFHKDDMVRNADGTYSGVMIDRFNCLASKVGFSFDIYNIDWSRAQFLLRKAKIDVLAYATKLSYRDDYAVFSDPVYTEKYVLVYLKKYNRTANVPLEIPKMVEYLNNKKVSVAMIESSAEEKFMKDQGLKKIVKVSGISDMVASIENGTLFGFIANLASVEEYEKQNNIVFDKVFIVEIPSGFYISNNIVNIYPNFMKKFNEAIKTCKITNER